MSSAPRSASASSTRDTANGARSSASGSTSRWTAVSPSAGAW
jgi:hypothetical protein